jgi:hypothetical protein
MAGQSPDRFIGSVSPATNAFNMRLPLVPTMFVMTDESLTLAGGEAVNG